MEKIRVMLVIPKLSSGGIERVASNFSLGLDNNKFNQSIYSIMPQSESYEFSVPVHILDRNISNGFFGKLLNFFHRIFYLRKLIKNEEPDVIISFGERCNIISLLTPTKAKKLITIHSRLSIENNTKGMYGKIQGSFSKLVYRFADRIVTVSNVVKSDVVEYLGVSDSKVDVIYNGFDIDKIKRLSNEECQGVEGMYFLAVGRITFAKGYPHLIRALSSVIKRIPEIKVFVAGGIELDGQMPILDELIAYYGLEDNIFFLGELENPYPYIKGAKALLMTSIFEGFPGVVIESLSCGTPVISTDCGGGTEVILSNHQENALNPCDIKISKLGAITPPMMHDIDLKGPLSESEIKFGNAMELAYINSDIFERELLLSKAKCYSNQTMVDSYQKVIEAMLSKNE
ncbi:TPA: glycosyltransferase [Vibrio parahaemolyticus]|uniref:glycosyltransferase n=1 Tax=Vibrio parahaemolyticus TaxID=670 RepID=UPI00226ADFE9|nr:glycosyltransferase [Vibrio parahaemolyticus]MCX8936335.1 glycosyltransferase [Vibrio parahaemolyticus]